MLTFGGCGAVICSLLSLDTSDDVDEGSGSPETIPVPNNDVIDRAADNLDPGIKPPGGMGGGGGGVLAVVLAVVSGSSLLCGCVAGC